MGCCLTLFRLLALLFRPGRRGTPAPTGGPPTTVLALVAGAELLLAALAVSAATPLDAGAGSGHTGHPVATGDGLMTQLLAPSSHLFLMVQVELLTVVVPLGLWLLVRRRPAADCCPTGAPTRRALAVAGTVAIAFPAVIIAWHVPAVHAVTHPGMPGALGAATVRAVTLLLVGLALWAVVVGPWPALTARTRALAATVALELTALPGLVLLLAIAPLYGSGAGAFGLSALTDQRLAGALMMLVDLPIALVLARSLRAPDRPVAPEAARHPSGVAA